MERDIKTQFEKRTGVHVSDVKIIRESDQKMVGYVKLTFDALPDADPMLKNCNAILGDDGNSMWSCQ